MFGRRKPPRRNDVRYCDDPRDWSGGVGGSHRVVLLQELPDGRWVLGVIQTQHDEPVFEFSGNAANNAGVAPGSVIALPVGRQQPRRLGDKVGFVTPLTGAEIQKALSIAEAKVKVRRLLATAKQLDDKGMTGEAIDAYRDVLAVEKSNAEARARIAEFEEAIASSNSAPSSSPSPSPSSTSPGRKPSRRSKCMRHRAIGSSWQS